jgi:hypothetical protein
MNMTRLLVITTCLAIGMAITAEPSYAAPGLAALINVNKNKNASPVVQPVNSAPANNTPSPVVPPGLSASNGYPNGVPWQAMAGDFQDVKNLLYGITADTHALLGKVGMILHDLDNVEAGLSVLQNTLKVEVSVPSATADARNDVNDAPVTLIVHITQNGVGVSGLTANDFNYVNSFPNGGASYCGAACFTPGVSGVYAIVLNGNWIVASYAGALAVSDTVGTTISNGSALVTFDIPAAPAAPK